MLIGSMALSRLGSWSLKRFRRRAFVTTVKLDKLMAAAPTMGLSFQPRSEMNTPAASGMQMTL